MIYEIRVRQFMSGSTSLNKYYKNKDKAEEEVESLNEYLPNMYFVKNIKLEDEAEE